MPESRGIAICDLDGTLADTRVDLATAVNALRADYALPPLAVATVASHVGNGVDKLIARSLAGHDYAREDARHRLERHYHGQLCVQTKLYPTVLAGLTQLRDAGWLLAVVTNKPTSATLELLAALALTEFFTVIIGGDDAPLKPNPAGLLAAMVTADADPHRAWIIGDNWTDLAAGRQAGISRCLARYGFGQPGTERCDLAVDQFANFADHLCQRDPSSGA